MQFSDLLNYFETEKSDIDKTITRSYAPATYYVRRVNTKYGKFFDTQLKEQLKQKDTKEAWLAMEELFNVKLKEDIIDLKMNIAKDNAQWVALGKKGITRRDDTIYVNLSHPYYRNDTN